MHVGISHHYGWAVAVTATNDHRVVDRRRLELLDPGLPAAPIHHEGGTHELHRTGPELDDRALVELVAQVRASTVRCTAAALDALAADLPGPVVTLSVRAFGGLPTDIAALRRPPHESRADSAMYCDVLAEVAMRRGWTVHRFDATRVEADAARLLGARADAVFAAPRAELGPPWAKDHRVALAATVLAASTS